MKVNFITLTTVEAKETDTIGSKRYLVATRCGGIMEDPEIHYTNYQIINANSEKEAVSKYNDINDCSFYYGEVIKEL